MAAQRWQSSLVGMRLAVNSMDVEKSFVANIEAKSAIQRRNVLETLTFVSIVNPKHQALHVNGVFCQ